MCIRDSHSSAGARHQQKKGRREAELYSFVPPFLVTAQAIDSAHHHPCHPERAPSSVRIHTRQGRAKDPYCLSPGMRKSATAIWRRFMLQPAVRHRGPSRALDAYVCERSKGRTQDDNHVGCAPRQRYEQRQSHRLRHQPGACSLGLSSYSSSVDDPRPLKNDG